MTLFVAAAVVAAAFHFFCAKERAVMEERVPSGTQLSGTVEQLWLLLLGVACCFCCSCVWSYCCSSDCTCWCLLLWLLLLFL